MSEEQNVYVNLSVTPVKNGRVVSCTRPDGVVESYVVEESKAPRLDDLVSCLSESVIVEQMAPDEGEYEDVPV